MSEPVVSERFDVDDIRKIWEYNSLRHIQMTPEEIIAACLTEIVKRYIKFPQPYKIVSDWRKGKRLVFI